MSIRFRSVDFLRCIHLLEIHAVVAPAQHLASDPCVPIEQACPFRKGQLPENIIMMPARFLGQTGDVVDQPARPPAFGWMGPPEISPFTADLELFMRVTSSTIRGVASVNSPASYSSKKSMTRCRKACGLP